MGSSINKRARWAVLVAFFINGALFASWVSRIPAIQAQYHLSEGELGLVLLGLSAGVLTALGVGGRFIAQWGSNRITLAGASGMCILLPLLPLAPGPWALVALLFMFGAMMSMMDVAMNAQAVRVERLAQRRMMSSFHAAYSIGGLAGAAVGVLMAAQSFIAVPVHFGWVSVFFVPLIVWGYPRLLTVQENVQKQSIWQFPDRALWLLGLVAFCSAVAEGAMADWSAVYLTRVINTSAALAPLGFAGFSLTMTTGRMLGDRLAFLWPAEHIVRVGGAMGALNYAQSGCGGISSRSRRPR